MAHFLSPETRPYIDFDHDSRSKKLSPNRFLWSDQSNESNVQTNSLPVIVVQNWTAELKKK